MMLVYIMISLPTMTYMKIYIELLLGHVQLFYSLDCSIYDRLQKPVFCYFFLNSLSLGFASIKFSSIDRAVGLLA